MRLVQPRRVFRRHEFALVAILMAGAAATSSCSRSTSHAPRANETAAPTPALSESEIRDLDIAFYRQRADRDPTGATDLAHVASLYLQRSRDTGDPRDALRAEESARRSLANRASRNDAAAQVLASSLLAQHRFSEALVVARGVSDRNPESAPLRAALAEISMELGQYDSARVQFAAVSDMPGSHDNLSVAPRLARWAEIEGRPDEARRLMRHSLALARRQTSLPREQVAWFWLRVGDIEMRSGNLAGADSAYSSGLATHPGDYRVLAALCRLAAEQRNWPDAIRKGEAAVAANLDPATLGLLSDAYAAIGDTARSRDYAHVLDVAVRRQPGAYHRAWSLFLLDHGRNLTTVNRKIREEVRTRHDVYAYDLLAWSLHKQGRNAEAERAMHMALREGTKDPLLQRHADAIASAVSSNADQVDKGDRR
ncbi:MAG: tetratricopeptide repeat protein [bacterium]